MLFDFLRKTFDRFFASLADEYRPMRTVYHVMPFASMGSMNAG